MINAGKKQKEVSEFFRVRESTISEWKKAYKSKRIS